MNLTDQQIEELVISELKNYYNVLDHAVEDRGWGIEDQRGAAPGAN